MSDRSLGELFSCEFVTADGLDILSPSIPEGDASTRSGGDHAESVK
jgi:hypothetical protein